MEKQLTKEFITYESGFFDGKSEMLLQMFEGSVEKKEDSELDESWYSLGYKDAIDYYFNEYQNGKTVEDLILFGENEKIISESFTKRVIEKNSQLGKQIPIGKFKI